MYICLYIFLSDHRMQACPFDKSILLMFLHLQNATCNTVHHKKSLYSLIVVKNCTQQCQVFTARVFLLSTVMSGGFLGEYFIFNCLLA